LFERRRRGGLRGRNGCRREETVKRARLLPSGFQWTTWRAARPVRWSLLFVLIHGRAVALLLLLPFLLLRLLLIIITMIIIYNCLASGWSLHTL
jgi:hypothetical protein